MIFIKLCRSSDNPNSDQVVGTSGGHGRSRAVAEALGLPRRVFPRVPGGASSRRVPPRRGAGAGERSPARHLDFPRSTQGGSPQVQSGGCLSGGPLPIRRQGSRSEPQHLPLRPSKYIRPESCLLPVPPLQGRCSHSRVLSSPGLITTGAWVLQAFTQYLLGAVFRVHAGPH